MLKNPSLWLKNMFAFHIFIVLSTFQLCSKHHFGIKKQERMGASDNQAILLQKTWKSIKNVAENVTSKSKVSWCQVLK